jgi:hypothetical protein
LELAAAQAESERRIQDAEDAARIIAASKNEINGVSEAVREARSSARGGSTVNQAQPRCPRVVAGGCRAL